MSQQTFRAFVAVLLTITLAAGLYLGWHFTHHHQECHPWPMDRPAGCVTVQG